MHTRYDVHICIIAGREGSAADGRILRDVITRRKGLRVPSGKIEFCIDVVNLLLYIS